MVDKDGVLLFLHVVRKMSREVGQALQIPVMGPQVELLEILASRGAQKMSDLAAELGISLGAVTALADRMARAGMIERQRSTSDRRVILLVLTEHGNRILEEISETRSLVMGRYFGKLTEAEMAQMEDLCRKMLTPLPNPVSESEQQRATTYERQTTPEGGEDEAHDNHRRRSSL